MKKIFFSVFLIASFFLFGCDDSEIFSGDSQNKGKQPTVIVWVSTQCPHCKDFVPKIQKQVYEEYQQQIDVQLNVVNNDKFETTIPQKTDSDKTFESVTSQKCRYVPSWVVLDKDGNVQMQSCGSEKTLENMKTRLEDMVN